MNYKEIKKGNGNEKLSSVTWASHLSKQGNLGYSGGRKRCLHSGSVLEVQRAEIVER